MLTWTNIKAFSDSLGVQLDRLFQALGTGTESGTVSKAARTNLTRLQTAVAPNGGNDPHVGADMMGISLTHLTNCSKGSAIGYTLLSKDVLNLANHIKARGGKNNSLDAQAAENNERFSPSFAELARANGIVLLPSNVFPPVTVLGTFVVSGEGAGTFSEGSSVDLKLYGCADAEVEVTQQIGSSNIIVTAICTDVDGKTDVEATCTIPSGSNVGTKIDLITENAKQISAITDAMIDGGTSSDAFKFQTKVDRTPVE